MSSHHVTVAGIGGGWRAECYSCGWFGPIRLTRQRAAIDASEHR
jgi:hypothetical protein